MSLPNTKEEIMYDVKFRALMGITDVLTYIYFFGIPMQPELLPHISDIHPFMHVVGIVAGFIRKQIGV